jgi:hypothetical protein
MTYEELKKQAEEEFVQLHERCVLEDVKHHIEQSKKYKYGIYGRN